MAIREGVTSSVNPTMGEELKRLGSSVRPFYEKARAWYQKLESREKLLVQIGSAILGLFLLYNLLLVPIQNLRDDLQSRIKAREREVAEVERLAATYSQLKRDLADAERKTVPPGKDFSLFSVIEGTLSRSVGRDKIGSITPADKKISNELVEYTVDLKLTDVTLAQLVDALYGVRTLSVPVMVSNLNIKKRFQNPHAYDVDLTCFALGKNG